MDKIYDNGTHTYVDEYVQYALFDEGPTGKTKGAGVYQCYCKEHTDLAKDA